MRATKRTSNGLGQIVADTYTQANGAVYLQDTVTTKPSGASTVAWTGGSYFNALNYYFQTIALSPGNAVLQQTYFNNDGTHTIVGSANNLHLVGLGNDTLTGGGVRESFVFKAHPGQETITDFKASGPGHDAISLPAGEFASIAQIFHGLIQQSADTAVITLGAHSSITLDNVAAGALSHNDFVLRAWRRALLGTPSYNYLARRYPDRVVVQLQKKILMRSAPVRRQTIARPSINRSKPRLATQSDREFASLLI